MSTRTGSCHPSTSVGKKSERAAATRGKKLITKSPEEIPPIPEKSPLVFAHRIGPNWEVAQANPMRMPLMVDIISGAMRCPITMFIPCPP